MTSGPRSLARASSCTSSLRVARERPSPSSLAVSLAAERRRADKLESRVRSLNAKVAELRQELDATHSRLETAQAKVLELVKKSNAEGAARPALGDLPANSPHKGQQDAASSSDAPGSAQEVTRLKHELERAAHDVAKHERAAKRRAEEAATAAEATAAERSAHEKTKAESKAALREAQAEADRTSRRVSTVSAEHEKSLASLVAEKETKEASM